MDDPITKCLLPPTVWQQMHKKLTQRNNINSMLPAVQAQCYGSLLLAAAKLSANRSTAVLSPNAISARFHKNKISHQTYRERKRTSSSSSSSSSSSIKNKSSAVAEMAVQCCTCPS